MSKISQLKQHEALRRDIMLKVLASMIRLPLPPNTFEGIFNTPTVTWLPDPHGVAFYPIGRELSTLLRSCAG